MILADSDVLIDALRGREPMAGHISRLIQAGTLATTAITVFELLSGAKRAEEREKVEQLLEGLSIVDLDELSAAAAANARRRLEGVGMTIGMADYLIAGICLVQKAELLTRNRGHFERVVGLRLAKLPKAASSASAR